MRRLVATYRLTIAYDGAPFAGWAAQPGLRTVQGELEAALERILGEPVPLTVAGRTDAGVHAWGQVASFELDGEPPDALAHRLNAVLPPEIAVLEAGPAPDGFDARRDARSRTYCYRVLAAPVRQPVRGGPRAVVAAPGRAPMRSTDARAALLGTHDFTAFTPTQTEHVRFERDILRAEWRAHGLAEPFPGELLEFWIEADAFMRHMVRVLVGTMLEVAGGRRALEDFEALLGARRASAPGRPRRRTASTWRRCATSSLVLVVAWLAQLDPRRGSPGGRAGRSRSPWPAARLALGVRHRRAGDRDRAPGVDDLAARRELAVVGLDGPQEVGLQVEAGEGEPRRARSSRPRASIAKSASIAIVPPWSLPDGLASHSVRGMAKVALPSPNSIGPEPGQVMERGRRQLAGELARAGSRRRRAPPRPPAGSPRPAADAGMDPGTRARRGSYGSMVSGGSGGCSSGGKMVSREVPWAISRSLSSSITKTSDRPTERPTWIACPPASQRRSGACRAQEGQRQLGGRVRRGGRQLGLDRAAERDVGQDRQGSAGDHGRSRRQASPRRASRPRPCRCRIRSARRR